MIILPIGPVVKYTELTKFVFRHFHGLQRVDFALSVG